MRNYLKQSGGWDDEHVISAGDELPLWSAPFGIKLLDYVTLRSNIKALDVGCGTGFPAIELAMRLGSGSNVTALDPSENMLKRLRYKLGTYSITNVATVKSPAETMPFPDNYFDLIISNNGINNVNDIDEALAECARVCKPGGEFVLTYNTNKTMHQFYSVFENVLERNGLPDAAAAMNVHVNAKRKPVNEMISMLNKAAFEVVDTDEDEFGYRFVDAAAMFNHAFIKYWFLPPWKKLIPEEEREKIFIRIEETLNANAKEKGYIELTVPFAVLKLKRLTG